jgi:hypothetical protein
MPDCKKFPIHNPFMEGRIMATIQQPGSFSANGKVIAENVIFQIEQSARSWQGQFTLPSNTVVPESRRYQLTLDDGRVGTFIIDQHLADSEGFSLFIILGDNKLG